MHFAGPQLFFGLVAQVLHAVPTVQGLSDLLVGLNEALQLDVQLSVLSRQHVAVVLEGLNLRAAVIVAAVERLVGEPQVILFSPGSGKGLVGDALLGLQVIEVG